MIVAIEAVAARHDVRIGTFGHAGDGNLHPTFVFERDDPDAEAVNEAARGDLYKAAIALGGTITGEHGVGVARRDYLELQRGADAIRVMRQIKDALDPQGILNPGRVLA
jgi:glycolate oxidase